MEALSKYAEALAVFGRTNDYSRSIALLEQAVAIDSTFAMAWRRLSAHLNTVGQLERATQAAEKAYAHRDRLSEIERGLTTAAHFENGPETDEERALTTYESVLTRDSLNTIALNNISLILMKRREFDRAATLQLKAAAQDRGVPNTTIWVNALASLVSAGRLASADSLLGVWAERTPNQPAVFMSTARQAGFVRRDYDAAERLYRESLSKAAGRAGAFVGYSELLLLRGRVREALQLGIQFRSRQIEQGDKNGVLLAGTDSASAAVFVQENPAAARAQLRELLRRMPLDSFTLVNRPYAVLLTIAAFAADAPLAEQLRADYQKQIVALGKTVDRPAIEAFADGLVEFSRGRYDEALARFTDAERKAHPCTYCVTSARFVAFDRLGRADSAIATGEVYLSLNQIGRPVAGADARFRAGILQRLGELYEAKGMAEKALAHYQSFLDLWKNADPALQARVRDVRGRVARLQAVQARKR